MPHTATLRARLLMLTLLALLPAVGLTVLSTVEERNRAIDGAFDELRLLAAAEARDQEAVLQGARQNLLVLAHLPSVEAGDWASCDGHLAKLLPSLPGYINLGVADLQGQITCSAVYPTPRPDPPVGIGDRPHFRGALATRDFVVGAYQVGRATGRPSLNAAYPIVAPDGTLRGVTFAAIDATYLAEKVTDAPLTSGGGIVLLDREGTVVTRFPEVGDWQGRSVADLPLGRAILGGSASGLFEGPGLDGVERLQAYGRVAHLGGGPVSDAPLLVVVSVPREAILAPAQASFLRDVTVVGIVATASVVAVMVVTRRHVLDPLADLGTLAARFAEGDFRARLARPARVREFAELGRALEVMAARVRELDEVKNRFINTAAHELRTPMTPLVLQLRLLRDHHLRDARPEVLHSLDILDRNVGRLDRLVRDIVLGARAQAAGPSMNPAPLELNEVVEDAVAAYRGPADASGVRLAFEPGLPPPVIGDRVRLGQVLDNLLANALEHTPRGGEVRVETRMEEGDAIVRVADTGPGLRPEQIPRLFQPFSQLDDAGPRVHAGAGLGLYICKGIVELHGGRIWAESQGPGRGAVFAFQLPSSGPGTVAADDDAS